ncbi:RAG2 PHD domain containing protein [Methylobacterium sp. P31]
MNSSRQSRSTVAARAATYLVGQDGEGHWVAVETDGRAGGIFRTQQDAIRFACGEAGCRPDEVRLAREPIPFRIS